MRALALTPPYSTVQRRCDITSNSADLGASHSTIHCQHISQYKTKNKTSNIISCVVLSTTQQHGTPLLVWFSAGLEIVKLMLHLQFMMAISYRYNKHLS